MVGAGFPQALGVEREVEARLGVGWSMGTSSNLNLRLMTGWSALPTRSSPLVWKWKSLSHVQLFATPWTVHEILQARTLEWVTFSFSRGPSQLRDQTQASRIAGRFFTSWAVEEAQEYWSGPKQGFKCSSCHPFSQWLWRQPASVHYLAVPNHTLLWFNWTLSLRPRVSLGHRSWAFHPSLLYSQNFIFFPQYALSIS